MIRDIPILMSAPMVRATLRPIDPKWQTRRILNPQPDAIRGGRPVVSIEGKWKFQSLRWEPGLILWVRESLWLYEGREWRYFADNVPVATDEGDPLVGRMISWAHHKEGERAASIHMPRWASRITLEVTDVRVERLQSISGEDAIAEGLTFDPLGGWSGDTTNSNLWQSTPRDAYAALWTHINGPGSWDANPWVAAISFKRVTQRTDTQKVLSHDTQ